MPKFRSRLAKTLLAAAAALPAKTALAVTNGGGSLPWDTPLQTVAKDLTGPFAYSIALIGLACVAGGLVYNRGEIGDFMRSLIFLVMAISLLVGGATALNALGITGAVI